MQTTSVFFEVRPQGRTGLAAEGCSSVSKLASVPEEFPICPRARLLQLIKTRTLDSYAESGKTFLRFKLNRNHLRSVVSLVLRKMSIVFVEMGPAVEIDKPLLTNPFLSEI